MANFCPECGAKLKDGARFCTECGTALIDKESADDGIITCRVCGSRNKSDSAFCDNCGGKLRGDSTEKGFGYINNTSYETENHTNDNQMESYKEPAFGGYEEPVKNGAARYVPTGRGRTSPRETPGASSRI